MASEAIRHARLLRPFPARRLRDRVLHQVLGEALQLDADVARLLTDPPSTPEPWCEALHRIGTRLETLAELCDEAAPMVELMVEQADADFQRSVQAMTVVLRGMAESPPDAAAEAPASLAA